MEGSFLGCLIFLAFVEVTCYEARVVIPSILLLVSLDFRSRRYTY